MPQIRKQRTWQSTQEFNGDSRDAEQVVRAWTMKSLWVAELDVLQWGCLDVEWGAKHPTDMFYNRATNRHKDDSLVLHAQGYECKASAQERPYISRPSRTQQLANPKLVPELMSDVPNDLLRTKGVADEQLALKENERSRKRDSDYDDRDHEGIRGHSRKRARSVSPAYSADSVSTISTNRSWSRSPRRKRDLSPSPGRSRERKRKINESFSRASHLSASPVEKKRTPSKATDRNKRRRMRSQSPHERGRQYDPDRRGSWRNRSQSQSMDRSSIAKQRWSLTPDGMDRNGGYTDRDRSHQPRSQERFQERPRSIRNHEPPYRGARGVLRSPPSPRERSLSPFSKRLALTQAMNMNR
ncbi:hypothetical protein PAAG_00381 [Paracoccidioides lutzii Pb01]|uniref:Uncharacterized protein n=1 Tax=Paracoccidioides lutzii (strain ATCC MYA-826 / Pb01) TaxID=502779 RepID=C1GPD6_PARBA|nr:hypothetical protein PAAG_00381 [Paracoccidioides lutzii Pb01]EEH36058.2 hypothetical protein PAAG_00381 [Paracoccidioides lutzii Pb01]